MKSPLQLVVHSFPLNHFSSHQQEEKSQQLGRHLSNKKNPQNQQQNMLIYLKTPTTSSKHYFPQLCKVSHLKQIIQQKFHIELNNQILYLNGQQISLEETINLQDKWIVHINNRSSLITNNQVIKLKIKLIMPINYNQNQPNQPITDLNYQFMGQDKVVQLENHIKDQIVDKISTNIHYSINLLQSGRLLDINRTFSQSNIEKLSNILCILSQNIVKTSSKLKQRQKTQEMPKPKLIISRNQTIQINIKPQNEINKTLTKQQQICEFQVINTQQNEQLQIQQKTNQFLYQRIGQRSDIYINSFNTPNIKRKSQSDSYQLSSNSFKKKRQAQKDNHRQQPFLLTKIIVHKSKQEIQRIMTENSLINYDQQQNNNDTNDDLSVVSNSSDEPQPKYVRLRQRQVRSSPFISQKKMDQSQKHKINLQIQRLFCQQLRLQDKQEQTKPKPQKEQISQISGQNKILQSQLSEIKVPLAFKPNNLRNSITSRQSLMKSLKDKRSSRYSPSKLADE